MLAWAIFFQVTGDSHRGISLSGVSRSASAAGSRFPRLMAEMLLPESPTPVPVTRHLKIATPANHPVSGFPLS
jgi:hypothetical protein